MTEEHHENSKKYIVEELKGEIEQLRSFLCNQQSEFDTIRTKLEKEIQKSTNINDSLKKTNEIHKAEINELQKYVDRLHDTLDKKNSRISEPSLILDTETEVKTDAKKDFDQNDDQEDDYIDTYPDDADDVDVEISVKPPKPLNQQNHKENRPAVVYQSVENNKKHKVQVDALTAVPALDMNNYVEPVLEVDNHKLKGRVINTMPKIDHVDPDKVINDWDDAANETLQKWFDTFHEMSHMYQYILDRNYKISSNLSMVSVVSSSCLSIFSGFKLWMDNDKIFQSTSDIIMLVSNFVVAGITTMSKRYIDDNRNEKIRIYIEEIDHFISLVYSQYCLSPVYRTNAKDFFKDNTELFTKLMVSSPNLSIYEMKIAKLNYEQSKNDFKNV